jgi:hypothetical protein
MSKEVWAALKASGMVGDELNLVFEERYRLGLTHYGHPLAEDAKVDGFAEARDELADAAMYLYMEVLRARTSGDTMLAQLAARHARSAVTLLDLVNELIEVRKEAHGHAEE